MLILVTILSLLLIALGGTVFYQHQLAELSNRFLRLQVFGPQWICSGTPEDAEAFPSVFHIETRSPYGNATPQVQIELRLSTLQGVVLASHREKTDAKGLLDIQLPLLPDLPERVQLEISAERGQNMDRFQAVLQTMNAAKMKQPEVEPISLEVGSLRARQAKLEDALRTPTERLPRRASMALEQRILMAGDSMEVRFSATEPRVPVFLAVWNKGRWVAGRPVAVAEKSKGVTLALPKETAGMAVAVLFDYSVSPPEILQWEPLFQLSAEVPAPTEAEQAWRATLEDLVKTQAFKDDGCWVEFLPTEVDLEPSDFEFRSAESDCLDAYQCVLEGSISQSQSFFSGDQSVVWPPRGLDALEFGLTQLLATASERTLAERKALAAQMLEKQARFLARALDKPGNQADAARVALLNAPIVYDGMQAQNEAFRTELSQFCDHVRHGLIGMMCVILCVALCLVLFVLMMWLLRIPTGGWIWFATAVVVLVACGLAMLIASQSSSGLDLQSTIFQSYYGKGVSP